VQRVGSTNSIDDLKSYFTPLIFRGVKVGRADVTSMPNFAFREEPRAIPARRAVATLGALLTVLLLTAGIVLLGARRVSAG
jgi:hypothetical protein